MKLNTTSLALVVAIVGAASFALFHDQTTTASAATTTPKAAAPLADESTESAIDPPLPPNHPPISGAARAAVGQRASTESTVEPPLPPNHPAIPGAAGATVGHTGAAEPVDVRQSVTWKAPAAWPALANPNSIRIATHKVPRAPTDAEDAELSISRAGGDAEANIQRWAEQFDGAGITARQQKTVHGLKVTVVELDGKYEGGMGAAADLHEHWAMLGGIVEDAEQAYFLKVIGPAATVHAARADFNALIESLAPVTQ